MGKKEVFYHLEKKKSRVLKVGYAWTVAFFGLIALGIRRQWGALWGMLIISFISFSFFSRVFNFLMVQLYIFVDPFVYTFLYLGTPYILYAFVANKHLKKSLLSKGWELAETEQEAEQNQTEKKMGTESFTYFFNKEALKTLSEMKTEMLIMLGKIDPNETSTSQTQPKALAPEPEPIKATVQKAPQRRTNRNRGIQDRKRTQTSPQVAPARIAIEPSPQSLTKVLPKADLKVAIPAEPLKPTPGRWNLCPVQIQGLIL